MKFLSHGAKGKRQAADALVIPFWKGKKGAEWAISVDAALASQIDPALGLGDFKAKEGEVQQLYLQKQPEQRVLLVGLGKQDAISTEILRRCYGSLAKRCLASRLQSLNLMVPKSSSLTESCIARGMAEGILSTNYGFEKYKSKDPEREPTLLLENISFLGIAKETFTSVEKLLTVFESVYFARDLVNANADEVTPQYLVECAHKIASPGSSIKLTVFDKKRIEKEKMGLILAVNRGSDLDPAFIIMEYKGNPRSKDHVVLIGKGITYDTGGLNIKTSNMETMKCDMGGAAVCFGTLMAAAQLKLKVNLTIIVPATENSVSARSFKPGDVYSSYHGKTIEVMNTDAEGRLILADALAYAVQNLKPTCLIDFATLTGGIEIALGSDASGLMSSDDLLANALIQAGEQTYERLWRMPLYDEYKEKLKSDIADMKNWNGRSATSCVAAIFLKEFTGGLPWAHVDIASTAFLPEAKKYLPKYATGVGIRLMIEFLANRK